ncbi:MAG TPA: glycoside hydrolase TIM-barrel-like domain-containing protein [Paracoccaceae bacterium]|nr:glycoside hydrolase TIM-barrel-like domain-containing protein [Paracoccaceae bacterium]
MATLLLSAAGAAVGGSFGGTLLGLSGAVIGKAVGATVGALIDQRLLGGGEPVEVGRVSSFRVQSSTEGASIPRVAGRMRVAGQVIWSARFKETVQTTGGGGKGTAGTGTAVREYSYSISFAIALCEGPIVRIGRVWADGKPFPLELATYRLYPGDEAQLPDPLIDVIEWAGKSPAYRGTAYMVFEDLDIGEFGNRIPQFNVEVFRQPDVPASLVPEAALRPSALVRGVALTPGTGEYALAPDPVSYRIRKGEARLANVNNTTGETDLVASLAQLGAELPACDAVSIVVSWFGSDLRCGSCRIEPAIEQRIYEAPRMPWTVSGKTRANAKLMGQLDGRPVFGGTPSDQSIVAAIQRMRAGGRRVMFYPFILMDVPAGNGLPNPWTGEPDQPAYPWRGRITLSAAPGQPGSPDRAAAASAEVAAFFGTAQPGDFVPGAGTVAYFGADDWGLRRFVLHYAYLCALAGGVEAFCIGSELRSLTQIRDGATSYPAVQALKQLAGDVRSILGPQTRIGYAADWSEYFGHQPGDGAGDVLFNLDPLWSDPNIDFVGIDNYMPLSDWRDGAGHLDAGVGSIYDLGYLRGNVAGGEGFDWYYASAADRDAQVRTEIADTAHGEDWVFRVKDLLGWWSNQHFDRPGGTRAPQPTGWVPQSKPIWFTEFGCPAVDKATNQPNVFVDPKSSESFLPYHSSGRRDDFIQLRYLQAHYAHWSSPAANPVSAIYGGPMVDLANAYVWAWDGRPWPDFPARTDVWADGPNYALGHWISGRVGSASLPELVAVLCLKSGVETIDVAGLEGTVRGHSIEARQTARQSLQPLMLAYGFDATEREGRIVFRMRHGRADHDLTGLSFALAPGERTGTGISLRRAPAVEMSDAVRVAYLEAENDYQVAAAEASHPGAGLYRTEESQLPIALSAVEAQQIAERWLAETRITQDQVSFGLPASLLRVEPGDVVRLPGARSTALYRVDRIEEQGARLAEAVRIEGGVYQAAAASGRPYAAPAVPANAEVYAEFLDLPLLRGDEVPHAPWVAVAAKPWPGPAAIYMSASDNGYVLNRTVRRAAIVGETLDDLPAARPWLWSRGAGVRVHVTGGALQSRGALEVLNGANAAAIRPQGGQDWEVVQYGDAVLVERDTYRLAGLLRGQAGTEFLAGEALLAGADFVLLEQGLVQLDFALADRGLPRHFRFGPAARPVSDASYGHRVESFQAAGLRPYAPAHLRARRGAGGQIDIAWVRRTRIDGDSWAGVDVPLGEGVEAYEVRIIRNGVTVRTLAAASPSATYSLADQTADLIGVPFEIAVAQLSASFGAGPSTRIWFDE